MSYSPKHETTASKAADSASVSGDKKKQKTAVIIILVVLALVVAIALMFIFWPGNPIAKLVGGGSGEYVPETQSETTNISIYYEDGIVPTSGSVHGVIVIEGGGSDASELEGNWSIDDTTYYQFDGQGKGFMHTGAGRYHFRYSAENGILDIDFDTDNALDSEFRYTIEGGDNLTMTHSDGRVFQLTKVSE